MGIPHTKKSKSEKVESCMDSKRNFGKPSGQITEREPLNPDLFMKVGTRVGTITAYYEHVTPCVPVVSTSTTSPNPPVHIPIITTAPSLEQTVPLPPLPPVYDIPKNLNEPSSSLLPAYNRP